MSQDAPNYYDEQFNKRINDIAKPGATPPATSGSGSSSGGWGLKGVGGVVGIALFILFRVILATSHSSSTYTPSYQYTPPSYSVPPPKFNFPEEDQVPDQKQGKGALTEEELQKLLKELNARDKEKE